MQERIQHINGKPRSVSNTFSSILGQELYIALTSGDLTEQSRCKMAKTLEKAGDILYLDDTNRTAFIQREPSSRQQTLEDTLNNFNLIL